MRRPALKFRISLGTSYFLRVNVSDTREGMRLDIQKVTGIKHGHELAATVVPCVPEHGCVADMFFFWRGLRPSIIAHEASHAALAVLATRPPGPRADAEEAMAGTIEFITSKIWAKAQGAPL